MSCTVDSIWRRPKVYLLEASWEATGSYCDCVNTAQCRSAAGRSHDPDPAASARGTRHQQALIVLVLIRHAAPPSVLGEVPTLKIEGIAAHGTLGQNNRHYFRNAPLPMGVYIMVRGPHSTPFRESDVSTARPYLSTPTAWTVPISISVAKRNAAPGRQTGIYYRVQLRHNAPTARGWELHEAYARPLLAMHRVASCCTSAVCRSTTELDVLDNEDYEYRLRILDLHHAQAPVASAGTVPSGCSGGSVCEFNRIGFRTALSARVSNDNIDRRVCLGSNKVGT